MVVGTICAIQYHLNFQFDILGHPPNRQANAGDSRSVLSVNGVVKPMSHDHKPSSRSENNRIVAAGGFVEFGRVNGQYS